MRILIWAKLEAWFCKERCVPGALCITSTSCRIRASKIVTLQRLHFLLIFMIQENARLWFRMRFSPFLWVNRALHCGCDNASWEFPLFHGKKVLLRRVAVLFTDPRTCLWGNRVILCLQKLTFCLWSKWLKMWGKGTKYFDVCGMGFLSVVNYRVQCTFCLKHVRMKGLMIPTL